MTAPETAKGGPGGRRGWSNRRGLIALALLAALMVLLISEVKVQRRAEHDSAFCTTSCHHKSEHAKAGAHPLDGHGDLTCQQCHVIDRDAALKLQWQAFTRPQAPDEHGKTSARTCLECHEKRPGEWRLIEETAGHREHRGVAKVDCLSCHAKDAHEKQEPEKSCTTASCHKADHLHKATTTGAETCLSCHSYGASQKHVREPSTVVCEGCHSSPEKLLASAGGVQPRALKEVNAHVLHGGVACQLCHNAHGKKPKPPEGQPVCARCHQFENFQIGTQAVKGPEEHRKCEGCHKPHAPLKTALQNCVNCHEKNAKGLVRTGSGETKSGGTSALKHASCASCHLPHTWRAERSGCMQCHDDKALMLQTRSPPQHETCVTCHEVHGPPPSGRVCATCHAKTKGNHIATAPAKHKDCTSCHNPHAPLPSETRTSCAKCHSQQVTQVMREGPEGHKSESCFGCHQPHNNPLPPPNICSKCHAERAKVVATAGPAPHRVCVSCHAPHKFKITDIAPVCSKCHGPLFDAAAAGGKIPHQAPCKDCHTLHGSPGVSRASCFKCHEKVASEFKPPNEKHGICKSCHQPHRAAATAVSRCARCHGDKATIAAKWPEGSAHAKACNSCHQQHDVRNRKQCADCHAPEASSAMGSKHKCQQCHPPHKDPPGRGPAWWTRCSECHAAKVTSAKLRGPKHSDCKNCHQPHRFGKPECIQCHTTMAGKGLHDVKPHAAACASCHDPHVKADPERTQCLKCHKDRVAHEPNAQKCQACHMFK